MSDDPTALAGLSQAITLPPPTTFHTLPDELLFLIFFKVMGPIDSTNLHIAMLLSHVCSRWRQILLHHPLFWASITVPPVAGV